MADIKDKIKTELKTELNNEKFEIGIIDDSLLEVNKWEVEKTMDVDFRAISN